jgi:hypothetical protein
MDHRRRRAFLWGAIVLAGLVVLLDWHAVDDSLSDQDRDYIPKYLVGVPTIPAAPVRTYDDEIEFIKRVQRAVLKAAPRNEGLPMGSSREPRDLFEAGRGLCFDRSRVIEKILRYAALETRHIALFSTRQTGSATRSLLTPGVASHAVTEVRTQHGWLVVDSNAPWVSLDPTTRPIPMSSIKSSADRGEPLAWGTPLPNEIYRQPFTFVYGLYSRHGEFYPPYDFIPDVNYRELAQNLW